MRYERFPSAETLRPLSWRDVIQGQLGSCFFLSTLAVVAPTARRRGASYVMTLYDPSGRPVEVEVDDRFPTADGKTPYFARGRRPGDIRAALFEKAYAALRGGYGAINGGEAADASAALTGRPARVVPLGGMTPERAWALLQRGGPMTASTYEAADMRRLTGRGDLGGLVEDHVYAVLGPYELDGRRWVRLYTPLSPADAGYTSPARVVSVPLSDFLRLFDELVLSWDGGTHESRETARDPGRPQEGLPDPRR